MSNKSTLVDENLVHALAGAGGGMIAMSLTYPLINIGTRMQVQSSKSKESYKSVSDAVKKIFVEDGILGFYRGLESALFGIALTNGVYYYWYEAGKSFILRSATNKQLSIIDSLFTGALAGAMTVMVTNPVWVVNTRVSAGKFPKKEKKFPGRDQDLVPRSKSEATSSSSSSSSSKQPATSLQVAWDIINEDGVLSLWQGVWPALILVSNPSIQYMVFEQLKSKLENFYAKRYAYLDNSSLGNLDFFLLGAISKLVATFVTYPYIVVKSRMQVQSAKRKSVSSGFSGNREPVYESTFQALKTILEDEGIRGLYRGLESKVIQSVLTAAILFWAKESLVNVSRESLVALILSTKGLVSNVRKI